MWPVMPKNLTTKQQKFLELRLEHFHRLGVDQSKTDFTQGRVRVSRAEVNGCLYSNRCAALYRKPKDPSADRRESNGGELLVVCQL